MQFKSYNTLEFKSYDKDLKIFGYASIFGLKDNEGDVVLPGAFHHSLKLNRDVKFLWQHDPSQPIGRIDKLYEDTVGLYLECTIFSERKDVSRMIKEKIVDSLSIGYSVDEHFYNHDTRFLKHLSLFEISIVTFAANSQAKLKLIA